MVEYLGGLSSGECRGDMVGVELLQEFTVAGASKLLVAGEELFEEGLVGSQQ